MAAAGIGVELEGGGVRFSWAEAAAPALELAEALPHPWFAGRRLTRVGLVEGNAEAQALLRANERLARVPTLSEHLGILRSLISAAAGAD